MNLLKSFKERNSWPQSANTSAEEIGSKTYVTRDDIQAKLGITRRGRGTPWTIIGSTEVILIKVPDHERSTTPNSTTLLIVISNTPELLSSNTLICEPLSKRC